MVRFGLGLVMVAAALFSTAALMGGESAAGVLAVSQILAVAGFAMTGVGLMVNR